ncbi:hypothetical protein Pint_07132 [Pistacia integerrima]|uniref:Uncharacterized protein n=1 Tax=Pistacia integerrima TaxID=434235 RepID=A0ACC0XV81_9ROSI|nr:hypothetical protein Pint_07132 [Pistacia integerrima]
MGEAEDFHSPVLETEVGDDSSEDQEVAAISLHVLVGQRNPSTIRMHGTVLGWCFEVLIDGGSTHNFIQERAATHLGLPILGSAKFQVMIGNGDTMGCLGMCGDVALNLDGHEFVVDLFVLPFGARILFWVPNGPPSTTTRADSIASIGKVDACGFHGCFFSLLYYSSRGFSFVTDVYNDRYTSTYPGCFGSVS